MGFRQRLYNGLDQLINQVDYSRKPKCILFNSHTASHSDNINSMFLNPLPAGDARIAERGIRSSTKSRSPPLTFI